MKNNIKTTVLNSISLKVYNALIFYNTSVPIDCLTSDKKRIIKWPPNCINKKCHHWPESLYMPTLKNIEINYY